MSRLRSVCQRAAVSHAACCALLGLAVLTSGCAAKQEPAPPARIAPPQVARVEIEDDGLPAQLAPRNRRPGPDDPSQPWSPNYGTGDAPAAPSAPPAAAASRKAAVGGPGSQDPAASLADARRVLAAMQAQKAQGAAERGRPPADSPEALAQARRVLATMQAKSARPTRLSTVDEDTLVRRAIAEHEMQRSN